MFYCTVVVSLYATATLHHRYIGSAMCIIHQAPSMNVADETEEHIHFNTAV